VVRKNSYWHCLSGAGKITSALSLLGVSVHSSTWPSSRRVNR